MLIPFNSITGWNIEGASANLQLNTTTYKSGGGSVEYDKTGTADTFANAFLFPTVPIDVLALRRRNYTLTYWVHHANFTNFSYLSIIFSYGYDRPPILADEYRKTGGFSAGWNKVTMSIASQNVTIGSPSDADRQRGPSTIILHATMGAAANTFADLKFDACVLEGDPGCSIFIFGSDEGARAILDRPLNPWNRKIHVVSHINPAEQAVETIFETQEERVQARLQQVMSISQREALRRWSQYASRNNDWAVARDSRYLYETTVDANSGYSQSTPYVLNVADTTEAEFIVNDLGKTCYIAVLSKANRTIEFAQVKSISAGVSLTLYHALRNDYVNGDLVVSALADGTVNLIPDAALLNPVPIIEAGNAVDLELDARWAA